MGNKLLLKPWVRFVGQVFVAVVGAMRVWPLFMHHLPLGPDLCPLPLVLQEHVSSFCGFVGQVTHVSWTVIVCCDFLTVVKHSDPARAQELVRSFFKKSPFSGRG